MKDLKTIETVINYIESMLETPLSLDEVAEISMFSKYHFHRMFKAVSHRTLRDYIRSRRMTEAAKDLLGSQDRIIDIAFRYCYESQEAFSRAFKDQYGIPPSRYRQNGVHFKNRDQLILNLEMIKLKRWDKELNYRYVKKDSFSLMGMTYIGDNQKGEVPKLWNLFNSKTNRIVNRVHNNLSYGFEFYDERAMESGVFSYMASVEVEDSCNIPLTEMKIERVPANNYIVFEIPAIIEVIPQAVTEIYGRYLYEIGCEPIGNYNFELYDENFIPNASNGKFEFYIPIK